MISFLWKIAFVAAGVGGSLLAACFTRVIERAAPSFELGNDKSGQTCVIFAMMSKADEFSIRTWHREAFREAAPFPQELDVSQYFLTAQGNSTTMQDVQHERDVIILNIEENYTHLTWHTFGMLRRLLPLVQKPSCSEGFIVKVDTDIVIRYRQLAQIISTIPRSSAYFGFMVSKLGLDIIDRQSLQTSRDYMPLFADGGMYGMSADVAELLIDSELSGRRVGISPMMGASDQQLFPMEGQGVGLAIARSGKQIRNLIHLKGFSNFCYPENFTCEDHGRSVAFSVGSAVPGSKQMHDTDKLAHKLRMLMDINARWDNCLEKAFGVEDVLLYVDEVSSNVTEVMSTGCSLWSPEREGLVSKIGRPARSVEDIDGLVYNKCAEDMYRNQSRYVDELVRSGKVKSGRAHYLDSGWNQSHLHYFCPEYWLKKGSCGSADKEKIYFNKYADVRTAVESGAMPNARFHFAKYGRKQRREYSCYPRFQDPGRGSGSGCRRAFDQFVNATAKVVANWPIVGRESPQHLLHPDTCKAALFVGNSVDMVTEYVLRVARRYTGPDWMFYVVSERHVAQERLAQPQYRGPMLRVVALPDRFNLSSYPDGYNSLLMSKYLWKDTVQCEHVVVLQPDAFLLRHGIQDFFKYAYVGSPIYPESFPSADWRYLLAVNRSCGGNGGFSLRRRSAMLRALESCPLPMDGAMEDAWMSGCMMKLGESLPLPHIANRFGVGSRCEVDVPLGVHKPWQNCNTQTCELMIMQSQLFEDTSSAVPASAAGPCDAGERLYRYLYPDVDTSIRRGRVKTGWDHFLEQGRAEGRAYKCVNYFEDGL